MNSRLTTGGGNNETVNKTNKDQEEEVTDATEVFPPVPKHGENGSAYVPWLVVSGDND